MAESDVDPLLSELTTIALDNAFDAMVVTTGELDPPGPEILYVNPAFTRVTGYTPDEVLHRTPRILQGPKTDRVALDRLRQELAAGRFATGEIINYRKNGEEFWLQWRIRPVPDAEGRVKYFVSTQRDITERKKIERLKSEVIASVSHEMRSPLTSIYGTLDILRHKGQMQNEDARLLENARLSCERLIRLVNTLLDAEKQSEAAVNLEPVELRSLVQQAISLHRLQGQELGVDVHFEPKTGEAKVLADQDHLIQVLTNLLSNAIKFSPQGGTVRIGLERATDKLRLSVADRGPGIPEDFRPRLFQRFAQAGNAPSSRHRGIGLGLAISKDIVERLDGRIDYQTQLGEGTTFFVELPEHSAHG